MYAFDSDSEPEENFKLGKVAEEDQPQVKEIIEKGKKILPNYDEEALYGLYKRYYSVEHIFLNELNMIARRLKGEQEGDDGKKKDDKWINIGREIKTKVNKSNYNFLEDRELIRRAQQYLKNKTFLPERRPNYTNDQRRQNNGPRDTRPRNQQSNNQSYREQKPKQKFVEKVENGQEQKPVVEAAKVVEPSPAKEQKFKEKVEAPVAQTKTEQPKVEEKKAVTQEKPVTQTQKPQEVPKKEEPVKQNQPAPKQKYVESKPAEQKPVEQKPVLKQEPVVQAPKPATQAPQQPAKETQNITATHSIPTVQNFDPSLAARNFEQACSQNSFVLKFIQPQAYPQRISYIRTEDGGMKNVQIRVTGTSTSGSQKAL